MGVDQNVGTMNDHDALIRETKSHHRRLSHLSSLDDPLVSFFDGHATSNDLGLLHSPPSSPTLQRPRAKSVGVDSSLTVIQRYAEENGRLRLQVERLQTSSSSSPSSSTTTTTTISSTPTSFSSITDKKFQLHVRQICSLREELAQTEEVNESLQAEVTRLTAVAVAATATVTATANVQQSNSDIFQRHVRDIANLRDELATTKGLLDTTTQELVISQQSQEKQRRLHEHDARMMVERVQLLELELEEAQRSKTLSLSSSSSASDFFERQLRQTKSHLERMQHEMTRRDEEMERTRSEASNLRAQLAREREEHDVEMLVVRQKEKEQRKRCHIEHETAMKAAVEVAVEAAVERASKESSVSFETRELEHSSAMRTAISLAVRTTTSQLRSRHEEKVAVLLLDLAAANKNVMEAQKNVKEMERKTRVAKEEAMKEAMKEVRGKLRASDEEKERGEDKEKQARTARTARHVQMLETLERQVERLEKSNRSITEEFSMKCTKMKKLEILMAQTNRKLQKEREEREKEINEREKEIVESLHACAKHDREMSEETKKCKDLMSSVRMLEVDLGRERERSKVLTERVEEKKIMLDKVRKMLQETKEERRVEKKSQDLMREKREQRESQREMRRSDEEERERTKIRLARKMSDKKMATLLERKNEIETELRVALDRCERLEEEVSKARSAASSAFEASEHAKHGVLAHALQAKQSTVDILQEQLLQQQQGHMVLAKRSGEQQRRMREQHQSTCEKLERDFQRALMQAQQGAEKQIKQLQSRVGLDDKDYRERTFVLQRRHQDEMERMSHQHRVELENLAKQLEGERERYRTLRQQSSNMACELEEAATSGMLSILSTIEMSEGVVGGGVGRGVEGGVVQRCPVGLTTPTSLSYQSGSMVEKGGMVDVDSFDVDGKVDDGEYQRRTEESGGEGTTGQPAAGMNESIGSLDVYHKNGISAELYRTQLNHLAFKSKTGERLRAARREMESARAVEQQLEEQALEYGVYFSPTMRRSTH